MDNATRVTNNTQSLIDHALANKNIKCRVSVLNYALSDHKPLELILNTDIVIYKPKIETTINLVNQQKFKHNFNECISVNGSVENFENLIETIQKCKSDATFQIKLKHREGNNWMTCEILNLIKQRNIIYKKLHDTNPVNEHNLTIEFKRLKNKINTEIRKQKLQYFAKKWNKAGQDPKNNGM